jgi:hypothetical protein
MMQSRFNFDCLLLVMLQRRHFFGANRIPAAPSQSIWALMWDAVQVCGVFLGGFDGAGPHAHHPYHCCYRIAHLWPDLLQV